MKKNKLAVIFKYKCPQCHEGDMFVKPFKPTDPLNMNSNCDQCGLDFEQEPGFYYGAMFMSYMFTVVMMLLFAGFFLLVLDLSENLSFVLILLMSLLLFFKVLRGARSSWLGTTIKYDKESIIKFRNENGV